MPRLFTRIRVSDPKYWWISANVNYITNSYLDIAPISRTEIFLKSSKRFQFSEATEERAAELLKQENLIQYR
jgi:hypothetical protein